MLCVRDLYLHYRTSRGAVRAVDGVTFSIQRGKTVAIVGESGSGKSSLARAITRWLPRNVALYSGTVSLEGEDLMKLSDEEFRRRILWKKIAIVPQAAMNSLNPVIRVVDQVIEPLIIDGNINKKKAVKLAIELFKYVGLPVDFLYRYPFELSGGMRQRVCTVMALISNPSILILDEPTSALDVLTQANIMNLLKKLKKDRNLTYIFITHDIALASELADWVGIMYAGQLVEFSKAERFYSEAKHPYANLLLSSVPRLRKESSLKSIAGSPPSLIEPPPGCRFHPRCPYATDRCRTEEPPYVELGNSEYVRCWLYG